MITINLGNITIEKTKEGYIVEVFNHKGDSIASLYPYNSKEAKRLERKYKIEEVNNSL